MEGPVGSSMNAKQFELVEAFGKGIDKSINAYQVLHNAICITTPFMDFAGDDFHIYATEDGQITDGGSTISMFQSLRCYQDYLDWPFREDWMARHRIEEKCGEMICQDTSPFGIFLYAQGLSAMRRMFEAHPIGDE